MTRLGGVGSSSTGLSLLRAPNTMPIYVDGDACPVKEEIYRVARRHEVKVFIVSNSVMRVPTETLIELVVVKGGFDSADDWIVENVGPGDIVVTSDIPLAGRCLAKSALVLGPKGDKFTEEMIGEALATRALMDMLRQSGTITGGPSPFHKTDRSRFLSKLDESLHAVRRRRKNS
jgi:uncharacterized protein